MSLRVCSVPPWPPSMIPLDPGQDLGLKMLGKFLLSFLTSSLSPFLSFLKGEAVQKVGRNLDFGARLPELKLTLPLASCLVFGKLFNFSVTAFVYL